MFSNIITVILAGQEMASFIKAKWKNGERERGNKRIEREGGKREQRERNERKRKQEIEGGRAHKGLLWRGYHIVCLGQDSA